ncbi:MAG TPA: HAD family hydrolase [Bacteroidia bacterium]
MKKTKLIIFDIDGTLTDSVKIHQDAFNKSLVAIGVKEFNDKFGTYKHHTDSHIAKFIFETATNEPFDKALQDRFEDNLYDLITNHKVLEIAGAKQFIEYLERETEFAVCYATGSFFKPAIYKLEQINVKCHTDLLIASNEIEEREKLLETAIENALKHHEVERFERIISFGDGVWDLLTAQNLNIEFVGIGSTNYEILTEKGMEKHFNDFTEIDRLSI